MELGSKLQVLADPFLAEAEHIMFMKTLMKYEHLEDEISTHDQLLTFRSKTISATSLFGSAPDHGDELSPDDIAMTEKFVQQLEERFILQTVRKRWLTSSVTVQDGFALFFLLSFITNVVFHLITDEFAESSLAAW